MDLVPGAACTSVLLLFQSSCSMSDTVADLEPLKSDSSSCKDNRLVNRSGRRVLRSRVNLDTDLDPKRNQGWDEELGTKTKSHTGTQQYKRRGNNTVTHKKTSELGRLRYTTPLNKGWKHSTYNTAEDSRHEPNFLDSYHMAYGRSSIITVGNIIKVLLLNLFFPSGKYF